MSYPIIDTHTHLYFPHCYKNIETIRTNSLSQGVTHQIQIGCDEVSSLSALNLAKLYPEFLATVGVHPCDVTNIGIPPKASHRCQNLQSYQLQARNVDELFVFFRNLAFENTNKIVGFGETGFDLYHNKSADLLNLQTRCFDKHIELCREFKKPFILHSRGARQETIDYFKKTFTQEKNKDITGVWHCFSEDLEAAEIATLKYGLYLGIGGVLTYNNTESIRKAVKHIPIEFLVTETDAPFLVPRKKKNKKIKINSAEYLPEVIELIAEIKEMNVQDCATILYKNAQRLFNLN